MNSQSGAAGTIKSQKHRTAVVFTIGHSNKDILTFINLLKSVNVQTVVDCRSKPRSRWPHFNAEKLASHLINHRIEYELRGHNLGGLDGNVHYDETLAEMKARVECGERIALLCSEGKPEQCHRGTILAPALKKLGVEIQHLRYENKEVRGEQLNLGW